MRYRAANLGRDRSSGDEEAFEPRLDAFGQCERKLPAAFVLPILGEVPEIDQDSLHGLVASQVGVFGGARSEGVINIEVPPRACAAHRGKQRPLMGGAIRDLTEERLEERPHRCPRVVICSTTVCRCRTTSRRSASTLSCSRFSMRASTASASR
jgi:hypothetical protein